MRPLRPHLLLLLAGLALATLTGRATAMTWVVTTDADSGVSALQQALDQAEPGDEILVRPGIYNWELDRQHAGPLSIDRKSDLFIRGQGTVLFLGSSSSAAMLRIHNSSRIRIQNLQFGSHPDAPVCSGPLLSIWNASDIHLAELLLHGPAETLLMVRRTARLHMEECSLSRASGSTFSMEEINSFAIRNSIITENGDECGGAMIELTRGGELSFSNCLFASNNCLFSSFRDIEDLAIEHSIFASNSFIPSEEALKQGENLEGEIGWFCTPDYLLDNVSTENRSALTFELRSDLDRLFPRGTAGPDVNSAALRRLHFLKVLESLGYSPNDREEKQEE